MFDGFEPRLRRLLIEITLGALVALPISFIIAFLEVGFHPFLQVLLVGFICFWFLGSAAVYYYFLVSRIRSSISNANEGKFDPSQDLRTIRNKYQAFTLLLVIIDVLFITFFPTYIIGIEGNLVVFMVLVVFTALLWRKGRNVKNN